MTQASPVRNTSPVGELGAYDPIKRSYVQLILGQAWAAGHLERCGGTVQGTK